MQDHVLIISTGNQDLKIICKTTINCNKPEIELAEIGKRNRRLLHQALIDGEVPYKIIATEEELKQEISDDIVIPKNWQQSKRKFIDINADKEQLNAIPFNQSTWVNRDKTQTRVTETLCNKAGQYLLFPAKLHTVINTIKIEELNIKGGLVFYTDRKKCDLEFTDNKERKKKLAEQYSQEPIATGILLSKWLENEFGGSTFKPVNFLQGLYVVEGNTLIENKTFAPYDQPIAQKSTHIIDTAIKQLSEDNPASKAIVSHTGGIADAKPVITTSAKLHFNGNILELHDSEHMPNDPVCLADTNANKCRILSRDAILDAKYRANQRLWEGDFTGAWSVVSHIKEDDPKLLIDKWVRDVKIISDYMAGYSNNTPFDSDKLTQTQKEIIWKAFQVEAALQNYRGEALIIRALQALGTCREAMEKYLANKQLQQYGVSIGKRGKLKNANSLPPHLEIFKTGYPYEQKGKWLLEELGYSQEICNFFKIIDENFYQYTHNSNRITKSLRSFRNDITHNQPPTQQMVEEIKQYGINKKLWRLDSCNQQIDKLGQCFLAKQMTQAIFEEITPGFNTENEYKKLIQNLMEKIREPINEG